MSHVQCSKKPRTCIVVLLSRSRRLSGYHDRLREDPFASKVFFFVHQSGAIGPFEVPDTEARDLGHDSLC